MSKDLQPPSAQSRLEDAIRHRYPRLGDVEVHGLSEIIIDELGVRLARGEKAGFVREDSLGNPELVILGLEVIEKRRLGGPR